MKLQRVIPQVHAHDIHAPALKLRDVGVSYGGQLALEQISFQVRTGDQIAIVGPNGAGKSTLFNLIAGLIKPTSGQISIYGGDPERHICVGYVPQRNEIDRRFPVTVADVVMMGRVGQIGFFRQPGRTDRQAVEDALARVGMWELRKRQIGELSGGQQQRVLLARALAQGAELLLMDEPLNGLDLPSQDAIFSVIRELHRQQITILIATHDLNMATEQFPLVMLLNRQLVAFGPPADVLTTENLANAYGNRLHVLQTPASTPRPLMLLADTCYSGGDAPSHIHGASAYSDPQDRITNDGQESALSQGSALSAEDAHIEKV